MIEKYVMTRMGGTAFVYACLSDDLSRYRYDFTHWEYGIDVAKPLAQQFHVIRQRAEAYFGRRPSGDPEWELLATKPVQVQRLVAVYEQGCKIL